MKMRRARTASWPVYSVADELRLFRSQGTFPILRGRRSPGLVTSEFLLRVDLARRYPILNVREVSAGRRRFGL
jgi:hypothetical protein